MPMIIQNFRENRRRTFFTPERIRNLCTYFSTLLVGSEYKFGNDAHNKVLSDCEFHENRRSGCHTLLRGFNKPLSIHSTFIVPFACNSISKICTYRCSASSNFVKIGDREGRYFCNGGKRKYIFARSVEPYDILDVKNALEKPVHCLTQFNTFRPPLRRHVSLSIHYTKRSFK